MLFGVIKNSEWLFFLVAKYLGGRRLKGGGGTVSHTRVGQSFEEKFGAQMVNTASITHLIDGQFSHPVTPRQEKIVPGGYLFFD